MEKDRLEVAKYLANIIADAQRDARAAGFEMLAYHLKCAQIEAQALREKLDQPLVKSHAPQA